MAWQFVALKKLRLRLYNGNEYDIEPLTTPDLTSALISSIVANPLSINISETARWNIEGPDAYYALTSLDTGSFDVFTWGENVPSGQYMDLYNPAVGHDIAYIRFTSGSSAKATFGVKAYYFTSNQTMSPSSWAAAENYDVQGTLPKPESMGIGFLYDPDTGQRAYFAARRRDTWAGSPGADPKNAYYYLTGSSNFTTIQACLMALMDGNIVIPPEPTTDPYAGGGYSEGGIGGGGDFDDSSDVISLPSVPSLNLTLNHFIAAYVPSLTDIDNLADWIWGNYDKFDSTKVLGKLFTEPMESILSLHMLPYTPSHSSAISVVIGNFATGLSMPPLSKQFEDINCGSLTFSEYWGNYLDYNPFTKIILCLPYVGQVDLDPDEVMGKTVKVLYRVDNLTGAFVCFVYIDGDKILGQYSGSCILTVPVTAGSYAALNAAVLSIAATAAVGFGGAVASAIGGGYGGMLAAKEGLKLGAGALGETMSSAAGNVNGMKLKVTHSGGLTGASGFMGAQTPYAIIHRPRQSVPENFNQFGGYPSNITMTLEDCSGFTSVRTCVYDGLPFTDAEIKELDEILKGGVFI